MIRFTTCGFLLGLVLGTAVDTRGQSRPEEEVRKEIERLEKRIHLPPVMEPSPVTKIGSRQYCAVDHGSAPPSQRPFRWCEYDDMASCVEVTRDHSNYSCEQAQARGYKAAR